jgi:hypothetical protein
MKVFTDHENNTFHGLKASDCILCWLLFMKEHVVTLKFLLGKKNDVADTLSCLEIDELKIQEEE